MGEKLGKRIPEIPVLKKKSKNEIWIGYDVENLLFEKGTKVIWL